ncbi:hypothetical protein CAEBREN_16282 [Caenorhabditis brenneri]|uniref:Uncharacterized protein n=1 Tax=Caenorhabditis brenneri TaxID=135651 RepID=G0MII1_CAEBE|nr:hypothetical protein CAEBREN_16282 [Caenorhabditis brenneri]
MNPGDPIPSARWTAKKKDRIPMPLRTKAKEPTTTISTDRKNGESTNSTPRNSNAPSASSSTHETQQIRVNVHPQPDNSRNDDIYRNTERRDEDTRYYDCSQSNDHQYYNHSDNCSRHSPHDTRESTRYDSHHYNRNSLPNDERYNGSRRDQTWDNGRQEGHLSDYADNRSRLSSRTNRASSSSKADIYQNGYQSDSSGNRKVLQQSVQPPPNEHKLKRLKGDEKFEGQLQVIEAMLASGSVLHGRPASRERMSRNRSYSPPFGLEILMEEEALENAARTAEAAKNDHSAKPFQQYTNVEQTNLVQDAAQLKDSKHSKENSFTLDRIDTYVYDRSTLISIRELSASQSSRCSELEKSLGELGRSQPRKIVPRKPRGEQQSHTASRVIPTNSQNVTTNETVQNNTVSDRDAQSIRKDCNDMPSGSRPVEHKSQSSSNSYLGSSEQHDGMERDSTVKMDRYGQAAKSSNAESTPLKSADIRSDAEPRRTVVLSERDYIRLKADSESADKLRKQIQLIMNEMSTLKTQCEDYKEAYEKSQQILFLKSEALNASRKEKDEIKNEYDSIKKEIDMVGRENDILINRSVMIKTEIETIKRENDKIRKENDLIKKENTMIRKDNDLIKQEKDLVEGENSLIKKEYAMVKNDNDLTKKEKDLAIENNDLLKKEINMVKEENDLIKKELESVKEQLTDKEKYINELLKQIARMGSGINEDQCDNDMTNTSANSSSVSPNEGLFLELVPNVQEVENQNSADDDFEKST